MFKPVLCSGGRLTDLDLEIERSMFKGPDRYWNCSLCGKTSKETTRLGTYGLMTIRFTPFLITHLNQEASIKYSIVFFLFSKSVDKFFANIGVFLISRLNVFFKCIRP